MSADSSNDPTITGEPHGGDDLYVLREPEVGPAAPSRSESVFRPASAVAASAERKREVELDLPADASVEEIWSPVAELWRPLAVGALTVAVGVAVWHFPHSAAVAVSLAALAFAAYWLAVTLERPVRLTPEQAVREYLECLAHWLPNHRRMWLLLSSAGRESTEFNSYPTFRTYWSHRLSRLRPPGATMRPLEFRVDDCDTVYNEDRSGAALECLVRVYVRGFENAPPLAELDWKNSVTKGPDGMWYLDDGRLPEIGAKADRASKPVGADAAAH